MKRILKFLGIALGVVLVLFVAAAIAVGLLFDPNDYKDEITAAVLSRTDTFNPQQQQPVSWPVNAVVGRSYLDQLTRSRAISASRASTLRVALERADAVSPRAAGSAEAARQLESLAAEVERDAGAASVSTDARRFRALSALLKAKAGSLR